MKPELLIRKLLKQLEKEKNIKILFAVENGSRAWGMASKDSDFDVRFVFCYPVARYVEINSLADVVQLMTDAKGVLVTAGALIDMSGFDIVKFARLLTSSNPTVIEWLMSPIVYVGNQPKKFKEFAMQQFNPLSLYHHYKSMCRNNYLKYLKSGELVTHKKYLYAFRGLVNAEWVVHKNTVPPVVFREAVRGLHKELPSVIVQKLELMIAVKAQGKEKDVIRNIPAMDSFIENFLKDDSDAPLAKHHATLTELNKEIQKIVMKG